MNQIQYRSTEGMNIFHGTKQQGTNSMYFIKLQTSVNTLRPRRNEHFADDIFKRIFFNENVWISIKISLKFVPKGPINNIPALVQIMAWRRSGDKLLSQPMVVSLPTHICVTRPQRVIWCHCSCTTTCSLVLLCPGEGTPSMLGDMDVPPFWPPFLTFWRLNSIFLVYFFSSTNTKTIFRGIKTTNLYRIRSFRPQISFFPRSFWVQFSAASGTPPSVFGSSTPHPRDFAQL